jgi:hypothetical protein
MQDMTYLDPGVPGLAFGGTGSSMSLRDGRLRGDFGVRKGFDGSATNLQGTNDPEYRMTTVNVVREEEGRGAGMVILSLSGRTLDELEPGEHSFRYDDTSLAGDQEIFANVCGGSGATSFDYDAPASRGTLAVAIADDGTRRVDLHTETPTIDPATGLQDGGVELSDSSFAWQPAR